MVYTVGADQLTEDIKNITAMLTDNDLITRVDFIFYSIYLHTKQKPGKSSRLHGITYPAYYVFSKTAYLFG